MIGSVVRRSLGQHGVLGAVAATGTQGNGSNSGQLGQVVEEVLHEKKRVVERF